LAWFIQAGRAAADLRGARELGGGVRRRHRGGVTAGDGGAERGDAVRAVVCLQRVAGGVGQRGRGDVRGGAGALDALRSGLLQLALVHLVDGVGGGVRQPRRLPDRLVDRVARALAAERAHQRRQRGARVVYGLNQIGERRLGARRQRHRPLDRRRRRVAAASFPARTSDGGDRNKRADNTDPAASQISQNHDPLRCCPAVAGVPVSV
jgi:hypothetical protein